MRGPWGGDAKGKARERERGEYKIEEDVYSRGEKRVINERRE